MNNFVPKCLGCKQIIIDTYIQALGGHYHKNCFVCQVDLLIKKIYNSIFFVFRNVLNRF
jgi:hypothetical protein